MEPVYLPNIPGIAMYLVQTPIPLLKIPCVEEVRWGRYEAQESIVLSMSNELLFPVLKHDTHMLRTEYFGTYF